MPCFVIAKLKVLRCLFGIQPQKDEIIRGGRKLDRFSQRMVQYSNFHVLLDWFILQEIFAEDGSFHLFIVSGSFFLIFTY
jgi:hypothetical protein